MVITQWWVLFEWRVRWWVVGVMGAVLTDVRVAMEGVEVNVDGRRCVHMW